MQLFGHWVFIPALNGLTVNFHMLTHHWQTFEQWQWNKRHKLTYSTICQQTNFISSHVLFNSRTSQLADSKFL